MLIIPEWYFTAFMPIVEFKLGDRTIRFKDWMGSSVAAGLNNPVPVIYDSSEPSVAMIDRHVWNWIPWARLLFWVSFWC